MSVRIVTQSISKSRQTMAAPNAASGRKLASARKIRQVSFVPRDDLTWGHASRGIERFGKHESELLSRLIHGQLKGL